MAVEMKLRDASPENISNDEHFFSRITTENVYETL